MYFEIGIYILSIFDCYVIFQISFRKSTKVFLKMFNMLDNVELLFTAGKGQASLLSGYQITCSLLLALKVECKKHSSSAFRATVNSDCFCWVGNSGHYSHFARSLLNP